MLRLSQNCLCSWQLGSKYRRTMRALVWVWVWVFWATNPVSYADPTSICSDVFGRAAGRKYTWHWRPRGTKTLDSRQFGFSLLPLWVQISYFQPHGIWERFRQQQEGTATSCDCSWELSVFFPDLTECCWCAMVTLFPASRNTVPRISVEEAERRGCSQQSPQRAKVQELLARRRKGRICVVPSQARLLELCMTLRGDCGFVKLGFTSRQSQECLSLQRFEQPNFNSSCGFWLWFCSGGD